MSTLTDLLGGDPLGEFVAGVWAAANPGTQNRVVATAISREREQYSGTEVSFLSDVRAFRLVSYARLAAMGCGPRPASA